jgi:hypothetical protein
VDAVPTWASNSFLVIVLGFRKDFLGTETVTTVGGLIPLWLGGGPMWESMAIAIIFGLIFATLLTLGVVPVLYSLFFRVSFKGFRYEGTYPK